MEIQLLKHPTDEDWFAVKERALVTVGKHAVNPPDREWKERILLARHSPIRWLDFSFLVKDVPYFVSVHLVRHIHAQPYVRSQRNDRQSQYDRTKAPQDAPVDMIWDMNAEELMIIANKRLCGCASAETRNLISDICNIVIDANPEFARVLVPNCVAQGYCYEMKSCGYFHTHDFARRLAEYRRGL